MSGGFPQGAIHGQVAQTQAAVMNSPTKSLTGNASTTVSPGVAYSKMPVTTSSSLSQVLRMPPLHTFQALPSLSFALSYGGGGSTADESYVHSDNRYGIPRDTFIKEEKPSPAHMQQHHHHQHHHPHPVRPPSNASNPGSIASPAPRSYSPVSDRENGEGDKVGMATARDVYERGALSSGGGTKAKSMVGAGTSVVSNHHNLSSLMLITVPSFQGNNAVRTSAGHTSPAECPTVVLSGPDVLRYPPNGDALLSASAINYVDSEMLPESGFDVSVGTSLGSLDDGLLSGNLGVGGGGGSGTSTFDLFDGEAEQEAYLGEGSQELQLSPNAFPSNVEAFGLNDANSLPDKADGSRQGDVLPNSQDTGKLSVPYMDKLKPKARASKATSPNRTGTQVCQICSKVFSNSSALAKHKLTHSDERKYVCQMCTKAFKRQDHLNGHLLTHMNKKPYECKVDGCGKSYCDARSLRRHTENHHSGTSQAVIAAATAATVSAIAVRVGVPSEPSTSEGSSQVNGTSFLATALQSNRIRYAPPPSVSRSATTVARGPLPPPPYTSSPPKMAAINPPAPTTTTAATTRAISHSVPSAASQLQLLAFQQQDQQQGGAERTATSMASWQPQSNIHYMSGSVEPRQQKPLIMEEQQQQHKIVAVQTQQLQEQPLATLLSSAPTAIERSKASVDRPSDVVNSFMDTDVGSPLKTQQMQNPLASTLAKHLKEPTGLLSRLPQLSDMVTSGQSLPHDLDQVLQPRNHWERSPEYHPVTTNVSTSATTDTTMALSTGSDLKPVECNVCQRKFKNIPALNGHMRLHGGYLKKESDGCRKPEKKSESGSHHPPLQTASINIRALIEEKIIQKRIVNPPLDTSISAPPLPPPPVPPPPSTHFLCRLSRPDLCKIPTLAYTTAVQATGGVGMVSAHQGDLLTLSTTHLAESEIAHIHQHQHALHSSPVLTAMNPLPHLDQQQHELPPPPLPPPPHHHHHHPPPSMPHHQQVDDLDMHSYGSTSSVEDDAQSDMQRQIEIIKQGLMSHQPISEKFRRHSDSDHFLTPPCRRDYHQLGSISLDFLRQKVGGKRTQRTGSDPGEFAIGNFSAMFPAGLVDMGGCMQPDDSDMDDGCQHPGGSEMDECSAGGNEDDTDLMDGVPPSEMMDFEMGDTLQEALDLAPPPPPLPPPPMSSTSTLHHGESSILAAALTTPSLHLDSGQSSLFLCESHPPMVHSAPPVPMTPTSVASIAVPKVKVEEVDDDVFLSPSSIPTSPIRTKKKHRPEPLYIPPQVSTCGFQSRLRSPRLWDPIGGGKTCSPPPYTPPPMLSPVRSAPGLFWHVMSGSGSLTPKSAPLTPGRGMSVAEIQPVPEDEEEDISEQPPETDILPHVNIGPQYQAELPAFRTSSLSLLDNKLDDLVWDPKSEESASDKEVDMYLQFACCAAIPGGGRNKEYALHVLQICGGNIQDAMLKLMEQNPKLPKNHPLLTYNYAESDRWSAEEVEAYQQALAICDKDFFCIAQEIKTKSVKQCIQFYYLWKKICPDEYKRLRMVRRKRELDGTNYNLRSKPGDDGANDAESSNTPKCEDQNPSPGRQNDPQTERFVCEYPDCFASFVSRQALNGHIRIHGGNVGPKPTQSNFGYSRSPASNNNNEDSGSQQYSPSTNPASNASTQYGDPVEEFPCKICGKVFFKVKSRSAHMKSHRPVVSDRR